MSYPIDNRLRPAVEFIPAAAAVLAAGMLVRMPELFLTPRAVAPVMAAGLLLFAAWRSWQGLQVLKYRRHLRCVPRYLLAPAEIPVSRRALFLGRGFRWTQTHTQRVFQARDPDVRRKYLHPSWFYRLARSSEMALEHTPLARLARLTRADSPWNPVRPLPEVGGDSVLHGVEIDEQEMWMNLGERVGHTLVLGTTRVGKTRLAELLITQDIRRGDVVVVFDPKGDEALLKRVYAEAKRAGRAGEFQVFDLGNPDWSARYNPIGSFTRITEVATRLANQLPGEGNSAAFKQFAWRFSNGIARAMVALGIRPSLPEIQRYVTNIEPLFLQYTKWWLDKEGPPNWEQQVTRLEGEVGDDKNLLFTYKGRSHRAIALIQYLQSNNLYDPVADGLRSAIAYDRTFFDKLVASLLPLLEKLTSGRIAELLAPDYGDASDPRPIIEWREVIRRRGIVYVSLRALTDTQVAAAVGNSMFADLTSVAGEIYTRGINDGLPKMAGEAAPAVLSLHADEFNELVGEEFIPMVNKAGGAGFQVTAYTQTLSDIEARFGSRPKAGQVIGNFNTLVMLRVKNSETAKLLTDQLPQVRIMHKVASSGVTDSNDPGSPSDFTSRNEDRLDQIDTEMVTPTDLVQLPKGQAFALVEGGQLIKVRLPLLDGHDPYLPESLDEMARELGLIREGTRHG